VEQQLVIESKLTQFMNAPVVQHFPHEREEVIETNVSDYVSACISTQYDEEGVLHPVAYYTKKYTPAECNYNIHHKEYMAITKSLKEWTPEYKGAAYPLQLLTDYKNLKFFLLKLIWHHRQAQ